MMLRCVFILCLTVCVAINLEAQQINTPINAPLVISGNFGEPRSNHFHTGVDFTTRKKTGLQVYAVEDGYVSRIKVSPYGYGRAIYVIHPNGLMSVYGHLSRFNDAIQNYVTEQQYKQEKYEVELYPAKDQFKVKKGEVIAYSGNSGSSSAPHLHFEMRDASGESFPLNPLKYKLPVKDTIAPVLKKIAVYNMDVCCDLVNPVEYGLVKVGGIYKTNKKNSPDTIIIKSSKCAIGVRAIDFINGSDPDGDFGVYSLEMKLDGTPIYSFSLDRLNFSEGKYANAEIDYRHEAKTKEEIYRCYLLPGNKASIYKNVVDKGIISIANNSIRKIEITAKDYFGNKSVATFYLLGKTAPAISVSPPFKRKLTFGIENKITSDGFKAIFPPNFSYDDFYYQLDSNASFSKAALSAAYNFTSEPEPFHTSFDLYIKPKKKIAEKYKDKTLIVSGTGLSMSGYTSTWEDGFVKAKPGGFGNFFIALDTIAPSVTPRNFKTGAVLHNRKLIFQILDNIAGIKDYDMYVDNKWVLAEFESKGSSLIANLGKNITVGEHNVSVVVTDNVNNKKTYKYKIRL